MSTVWIKHAETGGVVEVPETALPMLRQSGWDVLPDKERKAREKAEAAALADAETAMTPDQPADPKE